MWLPPLVFLYCADGPQRARARRASSRSSTSPAGRHRAKIPYNGPPQRKQRLRHPHLFFESNFNGGWEEYIDAFSHILAKGMTGVLGQLVRLPEPLPTAPFKEYIQINETEADHYYSAYPEATNTMIQPRWSSTRSSRAHRARRRAWSPRSSRTPGAAPDRRAARL